MEDFGEDFGKDLGRAGAIFVIGRNTGTNSPRMMTDLMEARQRRAAIATVNPMPKRVRYQLGYQLEPVT
jgi:anaerobic selenocysteine-containing dehydrogenase